MSDYDVDLAFRSRLASLQVATTGLITMSATANGYERNDGGNFQTDGFDIGLEVQPSGFPQTTAATISNVTATRVDVYGGRIARSGSSNRALTVGLPAVRIYENGKINPDPNVQYAEHQLVSQPSELVSFPAHGGTREDRGLYIVRWYFLGNTGVLGIRRAEAKLLALFTPGTTMIAGDDVVHMRGSPGAWASQISERPSGHALKTFTLPYKIFRINEVLP